MQVLPGMGVILTATTPAVVPGQQLFTSSGSFVVPANCFSISVAAVGEGVSGGNTDGAAGGRGGDLRYAITLAVTPGESLTVDISTSTALIRSGTDLLRARGSAGTSTTIGGNIGGGNGGNGGAGVSGSSQGGGGGGAGGYSGNGGAGGSNGSGSNGAGGGGGGGAGGSASNRGGGGGGGVGILGAGSNGAGGENSGGAAQGGGGGSSGTAGANSSGAKSGGDYGGGGGGQGAGGGGGPGGPGALRIIWGDGRAYPSTNTGDV